MQIRDGSDGDTIVVAGGAGFLGSHLCEKLLGHGHGVICVDSFLTGSQKNIAHLRANQGFSLIEHDICDPLEIDEQIDRIYNLACAASPPSYQADPFHTMMTCVKGTGNLLLLAEQHGARFLQASTSEIYGDPEIHPQTEEYRGSVNCTGPRACYDEGKRAAEALCFDLFRLGRVDARVARLFNTYGPRMQPDDGRIVSNLVVQALSGRALTLYGTGHQTRSFCYVSDMIRGLVALMERDCRSTLAIRTNSASVNSPKWSSAKSRPARMWFTCRCRSTTQGGGNQISVVQSIFSTGGPKFRWKKDCATQSTGSSK